MMPIPFFRAVATYMQILVQLDYRFMAQSDIKRKQQAYANIVPIKF